MPEFYYKAVNDRGKTVSGQINCNTVTELQAALKKEKLYLMDYRTNKRRDMYRRSFSAITLANFFIQISSLLKSGVPLPLAIDTMRKRALRGMDRTLDSIYHSLMHGSSLSDAVSNTGSRFPKYAGAMLVFGEQSGTLYETCLSVGEHYRSVAKLKKQAVATAWQPMITLGFALIVFGFTFGVIIPTITDKPIDWFNSFFIELGILIVLPILIKFLPTIPYFHYVGDKLKLKIPYVKKMFCLYYSTEFVSALSVLLNSGVEISQSFDIAASVVSNSDLSERLSRTGNLIRCGSTPEQALKNVREIDDSIINAFSIGNKAGTTPEELSNAARALSDSMEFSLSKVMSIIKPLFLIIAGLVVGAYIIEIYAGVK